MSDYQAQSTDECITAWCTLKVGHDGPHTDLRDSDDWCVLCYQAHPPGKHSR